MDILTVNSERLRREFYDLIKDPTFPCLGAKSALARGNLKIITGTSIASAWDDLHIHYVLLEWAKEYRVDPQGFRSLVVVFGGPCDLDESDFEQAMWDRLQSLADKDCWRGQSYDDRVSADPEDPHFSLSFGGQAFFVVGLHPHASRPARRFACPALVFNLHDQFERLREEGHYWSMREAILSRDKELAGSINPMLNEHGEASEARQYSGRAVGNNWKCPFRDPRAS